MTLTSILIHVPAALAAILSTALLVLGVLGAWGDLTSPGIRELTRVLCWTPAETARERRAIFRHRFIWLSSVILSVAAWWALVISW